MKYSRLTMMFCLLFAAKLASAQIQNETFVIRIHKGNMEELTKQVWDTRIGGWVRGELYNQITEYLDNVDITLPNPVFSVLPDNRVQLYFTDNHIHGVYENWLDDMTVCTHFNLKLVFAIQNDVGNRKLIVSSVDASVEDVNIDVYNSILSLAAWLIDEDAFAEHLANEILEDDVEPNLTNIPLCNTFYSAQFPGTSSALTMTAGALTYADPYFSISVTVRFDFGINNGMEKELGGLPTAFSLRQNAPNPFNPTTEIRYALPTDERVRLSIYNALGQEVVTLVDESKPAGYHAVTWNGRDKGGQPVATGLYIYRLQTGQFTTSRKMTLVK